MKHPAAKASIVHGWRALLLATGIAVSVSACGSGGSNDPLPGVAVDDSQPLDVVQPGTVAISEIGRQLSFTIAEDSALNGLFSASADNLDVQSVPEGDSDFSSNGGFTILSLPEFGLLTLRSEGQVFNYEPDPDYSGTDTFRYVAADGGETTVVITIMPMPDAPEFITELPDVADQGRLFSVELLATDADDDELRYNASNLPQWLTFNSLSQVLSGVPRQSDVGLLDTIVLTVSDGTGLSDTINYELEVLDINDPPSLNITQIPVQLYARETVSFNVFPDDPDNDGVSLQISPDDAFVATVDGNEITLAIQDVKQVSTTELIIIASDELGAVTREQITVTLFPVTASGKGITVAGYSEGPGVNIVILGDGYASDEQETFRTHVDGVLENIRSDEGISEHLGAFNIHMIETVSQQSGADDFEGEDTVDTAFNSGYNCNGVPRLLCAENIKVYEVALSEYPSVDQFILLVNDIRFGGSGNSNGRLAVTSARFPEIALHEMGHSLANLADEYEDFSLVETASFSAFEEGSFQNVSNFNDPARVPWSHWIDSASPVPQLAVDEGVGIFEGGYYRSSGVYRPTFNSRMREFAQPFGPVNTEQWILRLYTLTDGIRELQPRVQAMQVSAGEIQQFIVEPIFGAGVQDIVWQLNGEPLNPEVALADVAGESVGMDNTAAAVNGAVIGSVSASDDGVQSVANETLTTLVLTLPPGQHELTVTVSDVSGRIQVSEPHAGIFSWTWSISAL